MFYFIHKVTFKSQISKPKATCHNDMQLLEDYCLSEYYHFEESTELVTFETSSYICHPIHFRYFLYIMYLML